MHAKHELLWYPNAFEWPWVQQTPFRCFWDGHSEGKFEQIPYSGWIMLYARVCEIKERGKRSFITKI